MLRIMGVSVATAAQMKAYIKAKNPKVAKSVLDMIPLYLEEGAAEGVRGDIAFAQSCLETGNFTFTGSAVTLDQNNFAGIGVTKNGMKGNSWKSPELGIRAQIQHLKAYASDDPLTEVCVDPRFRYVRRGCAEYVEYLGMKENPGGYGWAAGAGYGKKIIEILKNILQEETKMKIYLSPSDQIHNSYAAGGTNEAVQCRSVAEYAKVALERNGYEAKVGKDGSTYQERVKESNDWGADVHVPVHSNAGGGDGTVVFCYAGREKDKYVKAVYEAVAALSPGKDDGIRAYNGLYEIKHTNAVCVYIEVEFHDGKYAQWIIDHVEELGEAIAKGFCKADDKTYKPASPKPEKPPVNPGASKVKYYVQAGAFSEKKNAEDLVKKLKAKGFSAIIKEA